MPVRITQQRVEVARQGNNAQQMRVTQAAVEWANFPNSANQQQMRVTQIAVEFPFPKAGGGGGGPPAPTQGNPPPLSCQPPPTSECVTTPALQVTDQTCEAFGS